MQINTYITLFRGKNEVTLRSKACVMRRTISVFVSILTIANLWADNGVQALERAIAVADAAWAKSMIGTPDNLYMADIIDIETGEQSGPSDVWPYTAAIEAHCSILECLSMIQSRCPELYAQHYRLFTERLIMLIDNLEYYRGQTYLCSYANRQSWHPFAVPRAREHGKADVSGILNVYDDQMWLARELIRAYRLTGKEDYLQTATELTDYVLDGWDCWPDESGREYGGITWGPGYNSKHACSNAPIIQPLMWLHDIYKRRHERYILHYRNAKGVRKQKKEDRSKAYLEWARKIYAWQKEHLLVTKGADYGVYADMMGAAPTISYTKEGQMEFRAHVPTGNMTGRAYPYNSGTMLAATVELYSATSEKDYLDDMQQLMVNGYRRFATTQERGRRFVEFENSDPTALHGFMTWFINVFLRAIIDAEPYLEDNLAQLALDGHLANLNYAFERYNRDNLLPIHLTQGWGDEVKTKGFHQFTFASEYAMLAKRMLRK